MARKSAAGLLTSLDDLFTTQAQRDEAKREHLIDIPLDEISDFPDHPFKVRMDEDMTDLADSIKSHGVLVPALVRPVGDSYQMVAGHRRKAASELAGVETLPCIVRDMTDDEAIIVMVDSNLQREKILPSEKAFAYKMKLDAMKRQQGERTDLTCDPVGHKLSGMRSVEVLANNTNDSKTQIQRYIRLTSLTPELLSLVDENKIAMRPAVELSYLSQAEQKALCDTMEKEDCTPSHAQAIKMRKFSEDGKLSQDVILSIMEEEKPNQVEKFTMPKNKLSQYFEPGTPSQTIEDTILKALEMYRQRQRQRQRDMER